MIDFWGIAVTDTLWEEMRQWVKKNAWPSVAKIAMRTMSCASRNLKEIKKWTVSPQFGSSSANARYTLIVPKKLGNTCL